MNGFIKTCGRECGDAGAVPLVIRFIAVMLVAALCGSLAEAQTITPAERAKDSTAQQDGSAAQTVAADSVVSPPIDEPTAQHERLITQLQEELSAAQLEEGDRKQVAQLLEQSLANVTKVRELQQATADIIAKTSELGAEAERLQVPVEPPPLSDLAEMTKSDVESEIAAATIVLAAEKNNSNAAEAAAAAPLTPKQVQQQNNIALQKQLDEIEAEQRDLPRNAETLLHRATERELTTRLAGTQADLERGRTELIRLTTEATLNLPALRAAYRKKLIRQYEQSLDVLQEMRESKRQEETDEQVKKAQNAQQVIASLESPEARQLLESGTERAKTNSEIVDKIAELEKDVKDLTEKNNRREAEAEKIQQRIRDFGAEGVIGRDLLHFQDDFFRPRAIVESRMKVTEQQLSEQRQKQLEYADQLERLEELLGENQPSYNADELERVEALPGSDQQSYSVE